MPVTWKIEPFLLADGGAPLVRLSITSPSHPAFLYDHVAATYSEKDLGLHCAEAIVALCAYQSNK